MKPRVFYGRFEFAGPDEWCVAVGGRVVTVSLSWRAAINLALQLAA